MIRYKHLLESLPQRTVVCSFGRFNPPTSGHQLLVNVVKKVARANNADHCIYASRTQNAKKNPLNIKKKMHYLNLMFPDTNFKGATDKERTAIEAVRSLNSKYKNLIFIVGSDRVSEFKTLLNRYNGKEYHYDSIKIVSAGNRDPDSDSAVGMSASKMRAAASKGDLKSFKKGIPTGIREVDIKKMMNDVRLGMKLDPIKEEIQLPISSLREQYHAGQIYNIGEEVLSLDNTQRFTIVKRGTNHIICEAGDGSIVSKWLHEVH